MIENYAVIDNGIVINVIVWDGVTPLKMPSGKTLVRLGDSGAWIDWRYTNGKFVSP